MLYSTKFPNSLTFLKNVMVSICDSVFTVICPAEKYYIISIIFIITDTYNSNPKLFQTVIRRQSQDAITASLPFVTYNPLVVRMAHTISPLTKVSDGTNSSSAAELPKWECRR